MASYNRKRQSHPRSTDLSRSNMRSQTPARSAKKRRRRSGRIRRGFLVESMAIAFLAWLGFQLVFSAAGPKVPATDDPITVADERSMQQPTSNWSTSEWPTSEWPTSEWPTSEWLVPNSTTLAIDLPVIQRLNYQREEGLDAQNGTVDFQSVPISGWNGLRVRLP